jgi:hypothetical protein
MRLCRSRHARAAAGLAVAAALTASAAAAGHAQDDPMTLTSSINAGFMSHSLNGSGTNPFFAFRTDYVVSELSVAEFALGYGQPEQDFGRSHFVLAEGQYQIRWPMGRFAPYAGMGAGIIRDSPIDAEPGATWHATFAAGAGVRAWLDPRTRVRTALRLRGIGADFGARSLEWTFGIGWSWW